MVSSMLILLSIFNWICRCN